METLNLGNGNWATKEDSLLAYNSENGNFKPLPFDFTRASSATVVNKAGLIETVGSGEPRIDFSNDSKGALLLEPSRSNLVPYSEDFSNATFLKLRATISSNAIISPDGNLTADKLVEDNTINSHLAWTGDKNVSNGATITFSIYAKKGGRDWLKLADTNTSAIAYFDLENGLIGTSVGLGSSSIYFVGNGWYRCSITYTVPSTIAKGRIYTAISDNSGNYQGDGTSGIYIYGAQLEQGSYATSYIPTQGSAVTRVADASSQTVPSGIIGQTEGVLYAEISALSIDSDFAPICLTSGTTNDRIVIYFGDTRIRILCQFNNSPFFAFNYTVSDVTNLHKIALKYKSGESALFVNGILIGGSTTTMSGTSQPLNILRLGNSIGSANFLGNVKDVRVYNTALTDQELQALTT